MFSGAKPYRSSQINNLVHVGLFQLVAEGMKRTGSLCSAAFTTPTEGKWLFVQYCRTPPQLPLSMINLLICRLQCRGTILHIVSLYLGAGTSCGCSLKPFETPHGGFRRFYLTRISTLTIKISFARDFILQKVVFLYSCVQSCPVIHRNWAVLTDNV